MNKSIVLAAGLFLGCLACVKDSEDPQPETGDFRTTAFFISNKDTLRYDDYSVNTTVTWSTLKSYAVNLMPTLRIISDSLQPKLYQGQQIALPYFRYYGPYSDHGTELLNNDIAPNSGSTVVLTITRLGDKNFDASFSGKVWSAKETDTLFIKEGQLKNVKLP